MNHHFQVNCTKSYVNELHLPTRRYILVEATNAASCHDYDVSPKALNLPGGTWQKTDPHDKNFPTSNKDLFHDSHTIASVKKKLLDGSTHSDKYSKKVSLCFVFSVSNTSYSILFSVLYHT